MAAMHAVVTEGGTIVQVIATIRPQATFDDMVGIETGRMTAVVKTIPFASATDDAAMSVPLKDGSSELISRQK